MIVPVEEAFLILHTLSPRCHDITLLTLWDLVRLIPKGRWVEDGTKIFHQKRGQHFPRFLMGISGYPLPPMPRFL